VTRQSINTPSATKKRIYVHVEVHNVDNCRLTCHKSMKYTCVIQFKLYLPTYARSQIPTYKLCLIVIRSKYATHIHHVFKNCLLRCARFAIYYTLAHSMFHRLLKFAFFLNIFSLGSCVDLNLFYCS
jgi:hypothetical protein